MSYSSEVRVSVASGNAPQTNVDLTLWELSTTIDGAGHVHEQQTDQDQTMVQVSGGTPFPFSFVRGPSFLMNNNHSIALAAYESGMPGPMFRSGRFDTLPAGSPGNPDGLVDIMLIAMTSQTVGDINTMLAAAMPLTLPDGNTVSTAMVSTAPPSRTVTLVATGPYGATTYTYTLPFTIDPSNDQVNLSNVLEANATGSGSITFVAGPGGGVQAFIDNLLAGLFVASAP